MNNFKGTYGKLKGKSRKLKSEVVALFLAYRKPEVPWYAKVIAIIVVAYALSPIDLIPDFIPVLGYLDDLILIPLGVSIVIKLVPKDIMEQCRQEAKDMFKDGKPKNWIAGFVIILIWILVLGWVVSKIFF